MEQLESECFWGEQAFKMRMWNPDVFLFFYSTTLYLHTLLKTTRVFTRSWVMTEVTSISTMWMKWVFFVFGYLSWDVPITMRRNPMKCCWYKLLIIQLGFVGKSNGYYLRQMGSDIHLCSYQRCYVSMKYRWKNTSHVFCCSGVPIHL